jgi:hypothetical protein
MSKAEDRVTSVFLTQKELRTAVGMMDTALEQARAGGLARADGHYPLWSEDAAAITELEQVAKRFRGLLTEA